MKYLEARRAAQGGGDAAPNARRVEHSAGGQTSSVVRASAFARKLAAELGLDLAAVVGTGAGGMITLEDVRKAGGVLG